MKLKKVFVVLIIIFIVLSNIVVKADENNNLNIYSNAVILIDSTTRKSLI